MSGRCWNARLLGRSRLDLKLLQLPLGDKGNTASSLQRFGSRRNHDPGGGQTRKACCNHPFGVRIEVRRAFIDEQDHWLVVKRPRQQDALVL